MARARPRLEPGKEVTMVCIIKKVFEWIKCLNQFLSSLSTIPFTPMCSNDRMTVLKQAQHIFPD